VKTVGSHYTDYRKHYSFGLILFSFPWISCQPNREQGGFPLCLFYLERIRRKSFLKKPHYKLTKHSINLFLSVIFLVNKENSSSGNAAKRQYNNIKENTHTYMHIKYNLKTHTWVPCWCSFWFQNRVLGLNQSSVLEP
jgi:hypothetical protein